MESAAALAKEVSKWNEVADFYRHASDLYIECGRSQPASDALAKGARYILTSLFYVKCIYAILLCNKCLLVSNDDKFWFIESLCDWL